MSIKVRKVGNSLVLTVPTEIAEAMGMHEGQSYDVRKGGNHVEYFPAKDKINKIRWSKYKLSGEELRDGLSPEEYVGRMRRNERI